MLIMSGLYLSAPRDVCKTKMMSCNGQRVAGNGQPAASDNLLAEGI